MTKTKENQENDSMQKRPRKNKKVKQEKKEKVQVKPITEKRAKKPGRRPKKKIKPVEDVRFKKSPLKVIPLGGLLEIGKNITVFEYEDEIIIVDCGLAFPTEDMLGIDLVVADTTYLEKNKEKIKQFQLLAIK